MRIQAFSRREAPARGRRALVVVALAGGLLSGACRQDMHDQPRYKPFAQSDFFRDDRSARPLEEGTVARGQLREDGRFYTGKDAAGFLDEFPLTVDAALVARGRERFDIYCAPCHGQTGQGDGMVVRRGYRRPPTFHQDRLRNERPGYFFDVMTNGFGAMPDYAAQVPVRDRWAIAAYIRALQLSQHATIDDVPVDKRHELEQKDDEEAGGAGSAHHD